MVGFTRGSALAQVCSQGEFARRLGVFAHATNLATCPILSL
jgi:hypothetical protein